MDDYTLLHGDCLEEMAAMDAGSVDAVVTDPPYGLGFMGKAWDSFDQDAVEASWSGKGRQQGCESVPTHSGTARTGVGFRKPNPRCGVCGRAMNGRDTAKGFKVCHCENPVPVPVPNRDAARFQMAMTEWAGECWRVIKPSHYLLAFGGTRTWHRLACAIEDAGFEIRDTLMWLYGSGFPKGKSCLKPAWEPIILARKPGPMRELGIEECRIAHNEECKPMAAQSSKQSTYQQAGRHEPCLELKPAGRWPANLILECTCDETREGTAKTASARRRTTEHAGGHGKTMGAGWTGEITEVVYGDTPRIHTDPNCPCAMLDGQTGTSKSIGGTPKNLGNDRIPWRGSIGPTTGGLGDSGGASRFFYCAKASRSERNAGCEGLEAVQVDQSREADAPGANGPHNRGGKSATNHHPTVKPLNLMSWLVKLVAQPGDVVLDPFMGSGTTGVACVMEGREFIGVEREAEYIEIARRRIEHASAQGRLPLDESPPLPPVAGRPT